MNVSQSASNAPAAAPDRTGAPARARGHAHIEPSRRRTALLTLGALGIVFGDIGTSPFYAMRESVRATGGGAPSHFAILAAASMIFWSLVLVVTVKYVFLIMRADNDGEGGVLALAALAHRSSGLGRRLKMLIGFGAILGLALFFGDGMLTPAITVLSAVEYVGADVPGLVPLVVPLTLIILVLLFAFQNRGTAKIGRLFGPIMLIWFAVLAVMGFRAIVRTPEILWSLSPYYAIAF
ncbi:MAG TPA: KUP/HAK/KT family potassium transporter, partial [Rhizomicrobium sp.]|nr:KUP/HAK/KT family potassium transporter [Rhizomicrobium sp.]